MPWETWSIKARPLPLPLLPLPLPLPLLLLPLPLPLPLPPLLLPLPLPLLLLLPPLQGWGAVAGSRRTAPAAAACEAGAAATCSRCRLPPPAAAPLQPLPLAHTRPAAAGPRSLDVLRFFAQGGPRVRAVRGNHDESALALYSKLQCVGLATGRVPGEGSRSSSPALQALQAPAPRRGHLPLPRTLPPPSPPVAPGPGSCCPAG